MPLGLTMNLSSRGPLSSLVFDNRFTRELPADPDSRNITRQVKQACFTRVVPTQVAAPELIAYSPEVADLLGLSPETIQSPEFAQVFGGNRLIEGMEPFAMCYGGHQFGSWAGQLGDGRAINLGEVRTPRNEHWTLQLKGAGVTPYSRHADGLAVLRSSVREFLCSEAMHHLGVPTTRALSLVLTGEMVVRDMFYDGNPEREPGAIVCRVSPSFTRFGNFEIFASRRDQQTLKQLLDFTIRSDFPQLGAPAAETYAAFFCEVCRRTAEMIVHWMRVGFVHGVMNTDNMSILGLTIDYGPYGWLENYDPGWTPNTTDASGRRYCFGNQPQIAAWNLVQLANAILPIVEDVEALQQGIDLYSTEFQKGWQSMMAAKLGLLKWDGESDEALVSDLLSILELAETDMTIFFRKLANVSAASAEQDSTSKEAWLRTLIDAYYKPEQLTEAVTTQLVDWLSRYVERIRKDSTSDQERIVRMNSVNPLYVLRNYLAQLAIDKATNGDYSMIAELLDVLRTPYIEQPGKEAFAQKRPDWARNRPGCSMLSCSS
jgi:serine/tyrosine/threonine adenylyltransferase